MASQAATAWSRPSAAWPLRALAAGLVLALLAFAAGWLATRPGGLVRGPRPVPALGHVQAAAMQQGEPTTAMAAIALIDHDLPIARARAAVSGDWHDIAAIGDQLVARARLTGSFDDYVGAGAAYDAAFVHAPPGLGPHLGRAGWNFAVHRLAAVGPDLDVIDRYAVPDDATSVAVLGMRGDLAFYAGDYARARGLYERAEARMPGLASEFRLANWFARMGEPARALDMLDRADARIRAPQQQLRAFIEMRRGMIELARGRWDDAQAHLLRADDIFPGSWLIEEQLATVRALKGDPGGAMALFGRMARAGLPDGYDGIAGLYRAQGDFARSKAWADRAGAAWDARLATLPEAALGHALDHLLAFGDPVRALAVAQRNHALRPYGDSATGLAWAYLANHRAADALAAIGPTLASGWTSAEAHIVASEAHALLGRGAEADAERAKALAINPHSLDRNPGMTWLEQ